MSLSRRFLLKSSGLALAGASVAPSFLRRAAALEKDARKKVLVVVFQRGAVDGLSMVAPYSDPHYSKLRPNLAVSRPGGGDQAAVDLDGKFGLHPALEPLAGLWGDKSLAVIHAAGSPDSTRSHFDAQDYMESGTPGVKGTRDGWMNRLIQAGQPSPLRAVSVGSGLPRALQGEAAAVAIRRLRDFRLAGGNEPVERLFRGLYENAEGPLGRSSDDAFSALRLVDEIRSTPYQPANGASYSRGRLGAKMQEIARLIKADVGLEIAFADCGGWDTHTNQAPQLNNLLRDFGQALSAFATDLGSRMQDVMVVTMSEFGRTAKENGSRGTDHGHANAMFVLGGGVRGGKVYGEWPGLAPDQLYEGRDLALTTDFRDVLLEAISGHLGAERVEDVFPGYSPRGRHGLLRS